MPLRKEGTNQTLICRCILCLMERREADLPEADAPAHVHGCTHGEQSENRESDKGRSTHTRALARRNPTPRQTQPEERAWVCVRSSTALLLAVCVRTHVFPHRPAALLLPLFPGQACFLIGSLMCGIRICVIPHQQRL